MPDPELPQLTLADLGILRGVDEDGDTVTATITPTYSGCPAMREISADLTRRLRRAGYREVRVRQQLTPPWTSDWITERGPREARRGRDRATARGADPHRPGAADADPTHPGSLPALWIRADDPDRAVQRHRLQGAAPVRRLPGTVRVGEGDLMPPTFRELTVSRVDRLTDDSAAVTFRVPDDLRTEFTFAPGQSLTLKRGDERRSYSICAGVGRPPRIGVREVPGGALSGWLVRDLRAGDVVEVQPPSGSFSPDLTAPGHHVLVAAGSGITPMLSIAASVLAAHEQSTVTLLYGNRRTDSVMFADEVADLKDAYPARMRLVHVLSREPQEVELFSGRLDAAKLRALLPVTVEIGSVDHWWLCGPFGMVTDAIEVLGELGVERGRIHRELFYVEPEPPAEVQHVDAPAGPGRRGDGRARGPQQYRHRRAGRADPRRRAEVPSGPAVRLQGRRVRHVPRARHAR